MKGSEFVNLLRKVIREEVRSVVKEELKEALKPVIVENTTKVTQTKPAAIPQVKQKQVKRAIQPPTFEGPMASLLAETYASMMANPVEDPEEEWPDLNMGMMTSEMVQGQPMPMSKGGVANMNQEVNMDSLMRDYSGVLKAAEAKAQTR